MIVPKIEAVDFGNKFRLGIWFLHVICFCFYVYLSLVFSACFQWWVCLLVWLLSSFIFVPLFVSVCVYVSLWILSVYFCLNHLSWSSVCSFLGGSLGFLFLTFLPCNMAGRDLVI